MSTRRLATFACCLLSVTIYSIATAPMAAAMDSSAQCTATFDAIWSAGTHPTEFPPNAHFSGLIGGTHGDQVVFWEPAGLATPGIKLMAETGAKSLLQGEVDDAINAGTAAAVVSGGSIAVSPGSVAVDFDIDLDFPLLTLVSMIAPSPDWFVGVHGLGLFEDGQWIDQIVVDLPPYDAGTDSGITFLSGDAPTVPPEPIEQISGHPFIGGTSMGTFTIDCTSSLIFADGFGDGTTSAWSATVQ